MRGNRVIKMAFNERNEILKVYPEFTRSIGQAMWCMFTGNFPDGTYRNIYLPSGQLCQHTWRIWAQYIAEARGNKKEDYSTYWESHSTPEKIKSVEKKFKKAGWKFADEGIRLDADTKLRDEIVAIISDGEKIPKVEKAKKMLKETVGILKPKVAKKMPIDAVGLINPKKRGRPPKVK